VAEIAAIKYRAFLSYSHRDKAWARWLHAGLESYRIDKDLIGHKTLNGSVPQTLRPIFRDREDFSAGRSLSEQTMAALEASQFLIVVCSPNAVKSKYVDEEIRRFKAMGHPDRIIPIIVDGEPNNPDCECFPTALRFKLGAFGELTNVPEEPIAADARAQGDGKERAKLKVVAGLLGLGLDDVVRRAARARKRRDQIWMGIAGAFLLLLVGLTGSIIDRYNKATVSDDRLAQLLDSADKTIKTATKNMDRVGFSISSSLPFLQSQEENLKKEIERGVDTPKLHYVWAQMLILFADTYLKLAETEKSLSRAKQASAVLEDLIGGPLGAPSWQQYPIDAYRKIRELVTGQIESRPRNLDWPNCLSVAYRKVGDGLSSLDRWAVALDWYRRSLTLAQALETTDASKAEWQSGLSTAYDKVGDASKGMGNLSEARANYAASLAIRRRLAAADPDNLALQRDLASVYDRLSDALAAMLWPRKTNYEKRTMLSNNPLPSQCDLSIAMQPTTIGTVIWL
jgi:tetratricopeptide (TPR) repeat protein